jgi:hypothetical protein
VTLQHSARTSENPAAFYESSVSNWGNNKGQTKKFEDYNKVTDEFDRKQGAEKDIWT